MLLNSILFSLPLDREIADWQIRMREGQIHDSSRTEEFIYGWTNLVLLILYYFAMYGVVFYGFSVMFPSMLKTLNWDRGDARIDSTNPPPVMAGYIHEFNKNYDSAFIIIIALVAVALLSAIMGAATSKPYKSAQ